MSLLEVSDLTVTIATDVGEARLLDRVSFTIGESEALGLVGESGSGKSMTALAVLGLAPEAARVTGSVRLAGEELIGRSDREMSRVRGDRIAMIFQEPMTALNPVMTVGDQIAESLVLHRGATRGAALGEARRLMARVGLPPERFGPERYPHELSGGQRQRIGIAIALACGPDLLIADEPTTALDVTIQAQILDLLAEIAHAEKMALLMITHDLGVVAEMTDRMMVMYAGAVVESGPTAEVFARMAHPYTRGLFAALPAAEWVTAGMGARARLTPIPGQVIAPTARREGCAFAPRCPVAEDRCRSVPPPVTTIEAGHAARCHRPGPEVPR